MSQRQLESPAIVCLKAVISCRHFRLSMQSRDRTLCGRRMYTEPDSWQFWTFRARNSIRNYRGYRRVVRLDQVRTPLREQLWRCATGARILG